MVLRSHSGALHPSWGKELRGRSFVNRETGLGKVSIVVSLPIIDY